MTADRFPRRLVRIDWLAKNRAQLFTLFALAKSVFGTTKSILKKVAIARDLLFSWLTGRLGPNKCYLVSFDRYQEPIGVRATVIVDNKPKRMAV